MDYYVINFKSFVVFEVVEVFHAKPSEMIQLRLEEKSWIDERQPDEEQWPQEFCLGE